MGLVEDLERQILWAPKSGGQIVLSEGDAALVLDILKAVEDLCDEKADEIENSDDAPFRALLEAARAADLVD